ncbi:hypothetical protein HMI56_005922 [Coelomomyces lativittatus]|nr:hypothetical protein HMI56_005922 [Coelomomyces lativittatus]
MRLQEEETPLPSIFQEGHQVRKQFHSLYPVFYATGVVNRSISLYRMRPNKSYPFNYLSSSIHLDINILQPIFERFYQLLGVDSPPTLYKDTLPSTEMDVLPNTIYEDWSITPFGENSEDED